MRHEHGRFAAAGLVLALVCASCGSGQSASSGSQRAAGGRHQARTLSHVLRVPGRFATIQSAVNAARPGDMVLVAPGVYHESVTVGAAHRDIVIRGLDRNRVVLDGQNRRGAGITVHADGVAVENLTVRRYLVNGVVFSPAGPGGGGQLRGWRGSYITAYDNGLYGVYAFEAERGRFDHVYASGSPDSGIYVGACNPCDAVVRDSEAERNQIGYEGTNSSGDMSVTGNVWRHNRVGAEIDSLRKEPHFPQRGSALTGNLIADNGEHDAPRGSEGFGAGVVVNGGSDDIVEGNHVTGNPAVGIIVQDSPDSVATDNRVRANRLRGDAVDLALIVGNRTSQGNCFGANRSGGGERQSTPARLEVRTARACGRSVSVGTGRYRPLPAPPQVNYRTIPPPPSQPGMPAAATAPAHPATGNPEAGG